MTSSIREASRKSFYPLPPSNYPVPIVDPDPAYLTTYGREHCNVGVDPGNAQTFRVRTMNNGLQDTYCRHGTGNWQAPYYRTDSKGFRQTYQQEGHVDADYMNRSFGRRPYALAHSVAAFAHPKATANDFSQSRNVGGLKDLPGQPWTAALQTMKRTSTPPSDTQQFIQTAREARTAQMEEEARRRAEAREIFGDPLLADPISNAHRKSRTVYQRAFGQCR